MTAILSSLSFCHSWFSIPRSLIADNNSVGPTSKPELELQEIIIDKTKTDQVEEKTITPKIDQDLSQDQKIKKKKIQDDDDDDDEIVDKKQQPSIYKQIIVITAGTAATLAGNYLKASPLITVPLAALSGSTCKSALRNVQRKWRYLGLGAIVITGFAADYLILPEDVSLNLGPTALAYLIAIAGRTGKLWILGKGPKDQ